MSKAWYYSSQGGQRQGPVAWDELKALARAGRLRSTDVVWEEGTADWVKASMVGGLFKESGGADEPERRRRSEAGIRRTRDLEVRRLPLREKPAARDFPSIREKPASRSQLIGLGAGVGVVVIIGIVLIIIAVSNRADAPADTPVAKGPPSKVEPPGKVEPPAKVEPPVGPGPDMPKGAAGAFGQLDLKTFLNWRRGEGIQVKGNDIGDLPNGLNALADVPFDVQGGAVLLGGSVFARDRPLAVNGIVVNRKFKVLHALHLAHFPTPAGTQIGGYVLHYEDGSRVEFPIVYGEHVFDWWKNWSPPAGPTRLAWRGSNFASPDIRFYATRYDNPAPGKTVASIDFVSRNAGSCPCCVALTIEN